MTEADGLTERGGDSKADAQKFTWSEWWAKWKYEHIEGVERAERWFYYFLSLVIFLAVTGSLGTAVYVGVLAISPIAGGLAAALPLGVPAAALILIGTGLLFASLAVLLRFVQIHWEIYQYLKNKKDSFSDVEAAQTMAETPLCYAFVLFSAAFVMGVNTEAAITMYEDDDSGMAAKLKELILNYKYQAAAIVTALVLGIVLAAPVVPYVMATLVASFGLPYGAAVLFGAVTAATIIAVTYQLLASLTTLKSLYDLAMSYREGGKNAKEGFPYFYVATAVIGVAMAAPAAYLFFVPLVKVLTPVLGSSSATFLAVATSVSLAVALMNIVPAVVVGGPAFLKETFYKGSSAEKYLNHEDRFWSNLSWGKKKGAGQDIELRSVQGGNLSAQSLLPQPSAEVPDNQWFWEKWFSSKPANQANAGGASSSKGRSPSPTPGEDDDDLGG